GRYPSTRRPRGFRRRGIRSFSRGAGMSTDTLAFFAPCAKGLEYLLVEELKQLGAQEVHEALAGVHFAGTLETGYRACLWSRLASRVLLKLSEFDANDEAALYAGVQQIDWAEHLSEHGTL